MDSLHSATNMTTKNCYMASIDLKDTYYCVRVATHHQKYLKFQWKNYSNMFTCCPMRYSEAHICFTKLLKPVISRLRKEGHQSIVSFDDSYLQGSTADLCQNNVIATGSLLQKIGFVIHPEKVSFSAFTSDSFPGICFRFNKYENISDI